MVLTHVTKSIATVATPPYWCTKSVNKLARPCWERAEEGSLLEFLLESVLFSEESSFTGYDRSTCMLLRNSGGTPIWRRSLFPFRKQAMPFLTVDVIIGNQVFSHDRCNICSEF